MQTNSFHILDKLSPEQIEGVLAENEYSPDGRAVVILPKKQAKPFKSAWGTFVKSLKKIAEI